MPTIHFTDKVGRTIRIEIDEDLGQAVAYHGSIRIGYIGWDLREIGEEHGAQDFILITHVFLDEVDGYTGAGIGTEIIKQIRDYTDSAILICRDTGMQREDGAHPTGNANGFYRSLVRKRLASWEDGNYDERQDEEE